MKNISTAFYCALICISFFSVPFVHASEVRNKSQCEYSWIKINNDIFKIEKKGAYFFNNEGKSIIDDCRSSASKPSSVSEVTLNDNQFTLASGRKVTLQIIIGDIKSKKDYGYDDHINNELKEKGIKLFDLPREESFYKLKNYFISVDSELTYPDGNPRIFFCANTKDKLQCYTAIRWQKDIGIQVRILQNSLVIEKENDSYSPANREDLKELYSLVLKKINGYGSK